MYYKRTWYLLSLKDSAMEVMLLQYDIDKHLIEHSHSFDVLFLSNTNLKCL